MTIDYTNKIFGTLWAQRLATFNDLCQHKQKTKRSRVAVDNVVNKKHRNKYWYCICTACQKVHIVRSDYLNRKVCHCQHRKPE